MQPPRRQFLRAVACTAALVASPRIAWPQAYPTRPVRMIVPYAPGGQTDVLARLVAQKLSEQFGKQFYVENILGGERQHRDRSSGAGSPGRLHNLDRIHDVRNQS